MSNTSSSASTGGVSFWGMLALLFIGLKLGGVITWSWWLVLAPLWISGIVGLVAIAVLIWTSKS